MTEWWSGLTGLNQVLFCVAFFFSALFVWQLIAAVIGLAGGSADAEVGAAGTDFHGDVGAGGTDFHADIGATGTDFHADVGADAAMAHDIPHGMGHDFPPSAPHDLPPGAVHDMAAGHGGEHLGVEGADTLVSFRLLSVRGIVAFGTLFGWAGALYLQQGEPVPASLLYALVWAFIGMLVVSGIFYLMQRMTESGTPRLSSCIGQPATVYMDVPAGGEGKVRAMVSGAVSFIGARAAGGEALKSGTPVRVTRLLDSSTVEVRRVTPEGGPTHA